MSEVKIPIQHEEHPGSIVRRVGRLITDHPLATLGLALGAGALGGAEWCLGALLGGGVVTLIAGRRGDELRRAAIDDARYLARRAREGLDRFAAPRGPEAGSQAP